MPDNTIPLLSARNLHNKFSRDIKYNLYYGIQDLLADAFGLKADNMRLRKKEFWTLSNINFDLFAGEILGIVGANGSGKTTLMRLLSNIYPLDAGAIYGRPGQKVTAVFALGVGMQSLFTGRENIYIKGSMYGMSRVGINAKMAFIEDFSELDGQIDRPFGNYSSGMRARLAYAIAIATQPDIFIIDEALAVGDSVFKAKCFDHLKDYVRQPHKAVLFVSNNIRKVLKLATRAMVMKSGHIIYESTDIKEALNHYILNCLDHLDEDQRERKLKRVQEYDM
ncbi:MAG: ABC transporter ATP-binding protein [Lewinellaceae bacterium]|nr:ABC transporter ATP-binding protein [Lewinellaceae bacterium]